MIASLRPLAVWGLVPTLVVAAVSLFRPPVFAMLEHAAYDTVLRAASAPPPGGRVIIVDVDEDSLSAIGQWPWRRDLIGGLITRLRDDGAAVVALDMIFAEPDRYEGTAVAPDAALARALEPGHVVLGYGMTFEPRARRPPSAVHANPCVQHPLRGLAVLGRDDGRPDDPFFRATGAVCSLPALAMAAGASGFLNAAPDSDGRLRRVPLLIELDGRVYPALGLAAVAAVTHARELSLRVLNVNTSTLVMSGASAPGMGRPPRTTRTAPPMPDPDASAAPAASPWNVPLDGKSNLLLRYRGPKRTFTYVSAADVLRDQVPPDTFRDKVVLVGTTALGTREVVSTPLDTLFTGVEVQATVADNLLQRDFIRRPENGVAIETLVVLLLGVLASLAAGLGRVTLAATAGAMAGAAAWGGAIWVLSANGTFLSPLFPTLGLASTVASTTVARLTIERRRADRAADAKSASQRLMIQTLLSLTEMKDPETGKHSRRTQQYTRVLALELARHQAYRAYLTPERIDLLATLAPLHDIGKVGVPDRVLNKPGPLTPEEFLEMRKHPVHGRNVIVKAERDAGVRDDVTLAMAKDIVYTHHEKWDGSGYPEGLRASAIPIAGRIMALVDVYDACTTRRLYVPSLSQDDAAALIIRGSGTHFDPAVVEAFLVVAPVLRRLSEHPDPAEDPYPAFGRR